MAIKARLRHPKFSYYSSVHAVAIAMSSSKLLVALLLLSLKTKSFSIPFPSEFTSLTPVSQSSDHEQELHHQKELQPSADQLTEITSDQKGDQLQAVTDLYVRVCELSQVLYGLQESLVSQIHLTNSW